MFRKLSLVVGVWVTANAVAVSYDCKTYLASGQEGVAYPLGSAKFSSFVEGDENRKGTLRLSMGEDAFVDCLMAEDLIWCIAIQQSKSDDQHPQPKRTLMGSLVTDTNTRLFRLTTAKEWTAPERVLKPFKSSMANLECRKDNTDKN